MSNYNSSLRSQSQTVRWHAARDFSSCCYSLVPPYIAEAPDSVERKSRAHKNSAHWVHELWVLSWCDKRFKSCWCIVETNHCCDFRLSVLLKWSVWRPGTRHVGLLQFQSLSNSTLYHKLLLCQKFFQPRQIITFTKQCEMQVCTGAWQCNACGSFQVEPQASSQVPAVLFCLSCI